MAKGRKKKSVGLGDTIGKVTKATGIDKVVKFVLGEDCGCDERQEKLNKLVPYNKVNCLTETEYNYLNTNLDYNKETGVLRKNLSGNIKFEVERIYSRIFNLNKFKFGTCPSCAARNKEALTHLVDVMNEY